MAPERSQACLDTLQDWGYQVRKGRTMDSCSENYFSGTDEERLADLQEMMDDPSVRAILCARGGYGLTRIIDKIDFSGFADMPKWIIGFSDITLVHSHIHTNYKIATLHAPMAGAFNDGGAEGEYVRSLKLALMGESSEYSCPVHPFNRRGTATGRLVGGNLALLAHAVGSGSDLKTKGKILFLEDVGEYLYNIDRMMQQLKRSGKLDRLAGLVVGGFTEWKDTQRPFGSTAEEIIRDAVSEYEYPVCFAFPVGHQKENVALRVGVRHVLDVDEGGRADADADVSDLHAQATLAGSARLRDLGE
jgi:muramoyltetrapeptide carboxypeptidase